MSPQKKAELNERARAFIDQVAETNRQFGMGGQVSDETYARAVAKSEEAVAGLIG